jgi:hypothetical protein
MSFAKKIKIIRDAYEEIPDIQDGFKDMKWVLFFMNQKSENQHRKSSFAQPASLTVRDAAKLFTVQHLLDGFKEPGRYTIDDITSICNEALYAQAYAKRFYEILTPWATKWGSVFEEVDYAELMKG